jgi:uncharacterized membrane protein
MLRPSDSLLGSSRAARRAGINAERRKWVFGWVKGLAAAVALLLGGAVELLLLCGLPLVYLTSSYLVLDLPARWLTHREPATAFTIVLFLGAIAVSLVALVRLAQDAQPIVPVRPRFARTMLALGWLTALVLTVGDLAS